VSGKMLRQSVAQLLGVPQETYSNVETTSHLRRL
jgi:hypothetical protein